MSIINEPTDTTLEPVIDALPSDAVGGSDGNGNGNNGGTTTALPLNPMPGNIRPADIVGEMQTAYLDYAMSVIVARALPDVRDGLKPVHRRILYAMSHDLYLTHLKPHRKSARIVGEVLGKYHPHGDVAVYDAMVRMAQEFSLRYPLVDGQGNFGSIDGDGAAAMRYTEARLAEIADLMLADLDKDTVEWHDNFDNSLEEPDVLPAALPNLLINGSSGIAVGMATNVPPHNLGEIVDALVYLIDRYTDVEEITVDELLQFVKGPDFPTGGILYRFREEKADENTDVIAQGYAMGKARLIMQAKAHFEEMSRGRSRIVVTELPYQTNKTALIERIASLARDAKIEGITDLRDESDRTGMRIVIELTRNADPKDVLKDLFKYTPLQQTFGMQMLALVDGQPRLLSLKRALHLFVQHREVIIRRRSEYDLAKARDRAHIVEGLLKALDILDEVIATIRRSQTVETARNNLVKNFSFSEIQAQAILDMQLRRLAALERKKLKDEHDALLERIAYLEDLLAHPEKILKVIREDLLAQKEKYGDARRTQIVDRTKGTLTSTDLLPQQEVWVTLSADGELRRQDVTRPTVATMRQMAKHGQVAMLTANTRDWLYLFCRDGRCARVAIHEIPQNGAPKHVAELSDFTRRDPITAAISLPRIGASEAQGYLLLATALGDVKRVTLAELVSTIAGEFSTIAVNEKDRLGWVLQTKGDQDVLLVTAEGQSIRFAEEDVRSMGLAAGGVGGIKLKKKDLVIHADLIDASGEGVVVTMTEQGYAKRSTLNEYSRQGRNGSGIVTHKPTSRTGLVATALVLGATTSEEELLATITAKHQVQPLTVAAIPLMGRGVQGKQVVEVGKGDQVRVLKRISESTAPAPGDPWSGNGNDSATPPINGNGSSGSSGAGTPVASNGATGTVASQAKKRTAKATAPATRTTPKQGAAAAQTVVGSAKTPAASAVDKIDRTSTSTSTSAGRAAKAPKQAAAGASVQGTLLDVAADAPPVTAAKSAIKPQSARKATTATGKTTTPVTTGALRLNLVEGTDAPRSPSAAGKPDLPPSTASPPTAVASKAKVAAKSATTSSEKSAATRGTKAKKVISAAPSIAPATEPPAKSPTAPSAAPSAKATKGKQQTVKAAAVVAAPAVQAQAAKRSAKAPVTAAAARGATEQLQQRTTGKGKTKTTEAPAAPQRRGQRSAEKLERAPSTVGQTTAPPVAPAGKATGRAGDQGGAHEQQAARLRRTPTTAPAPRVKPQPEAPERAVAKQAANRKGTSARAKTQDVTASPKGRAAQPTAAKAAKKKLQVATSVSGSKKKA